MKTKTVKILKEILFHVAITIGLVLFMHKVVLFLMVVLGMGIGMSISDVDPASYNSMEKSFMIVWIGYCLLYFGVPIIANIWLWRYRKNARAKQTKLKEVCKKQSRAKKTIKETILHTGITLGAIWFSMHVAVGMYSDLLRGKISEKAFGIGILVIFFGITIGSNVWLWRYRKKIKSNETEMKEVHERQGKTTKIIKEIMLRVGITFGAICFISYVVMEMPILLLLDMLNLRGLIIFFGIIIGLNIWLWRYRKNARANHSVFTTP